MDEIDGWVVVDKPMGPSSHDVVVWVRDILGVKRAGHSGTLDQNASGVLPIAVGKARKLLLALAKADKEYVAIAEFKEPVDRERLEKIGEEFTGKIWQKPPEKSAVKKRLRIRKVYNLEFLEFKGELVLFKARVQHGTYIRKLIQDWGEIMGNPGKMLELRRTISGPFTVKDAVTLQDLKDAVVFKKEGLSNKLDSIILPLESGVRGLKSIVVKDSAVSALCHGAYLARPGIKRVDKGIEAGELVSVFTAKGELIGLGISTKSSREIEKSKKGIAVKMKSIVMPREFYPKIWSKDKYE